LNISTYHPFRSQKAKEQYLDFYDKRAQQWPIASETRIIDTSYGQTFVRISGSVDTPALVLLPGSASSSLMWESCIESLSKDYRTYAVDNIYDIGRSINVKPMEGSNDFVSWLDELFNALDLGNNINLMGLSYGGWLTAQYALNFQKRLKKIVLLAPAATVLPFQWKFLLRVILFILPHRYFVKSMMYWLLQDSIQSSEKNQKKVDDYVDEVMLIKHCYKFRPPVNPSALEDQELETIKIPTLFLFGENEKLYSAKKAVQRLYNVAPNIETEIISNAGHDLLFVQQELVIGKVVEFLKRQ